MIISDTITLVQKLALLSHRGAGTRMGKKAADILEKHLLSIGASVERQPFKTSKTYIWQIWWIVGGICLGLILAQIVPWFSLALAACCFISAFLFFDWRSSPLSLLPPRADSENIIARFNHSEKSENHGSSKNSKRKLIIMAHYDSAPISMLYRASMIKGMQRSLKTGLVLMAAAVFIIFLQAFNVAQIFTFWGRTILIAYFLGMGIISCIDFLRFGYTKGASDNATGTAAAVVLAEKLWKNQNRNQDIELVLTGAEEAGMVGAKKYYRKNRKTFHPDKTFVLNFDSLGKGRLKIIQKTGSITSVWYDNILFHNAVKTARENSRFEKIGKGEWHTGDFDTIWFARAKIPSLTISAQDKNGSIPNLHRPEDTLDAVDKNLPEFAVDFAEQVIKNLFKELSGK